MKRIKDFIFGMFSKGRALMELAPEALAFGLRAQIYLESRKADPEALALLNMAITLVKKAEAIVTVPLTGKVGDDE